MSWVDWADIAEFFSGFMIGMAIWICGSYKYDADAWLERIFKRMVEDD